MATNISLNLLANVGIKTSCCYVTQKEMTVQIDGLMFVFVFNLYTSI